MARRRGKHGFLLGLCLLIFGVIHLCLDDQRVTAALGPTLTNLRNMVQESGDLVEVPEGTSLGQAVGEDEADSLEQSVAQPLETTLVPGPTSRPGLVMLTSLFLGKKSHGHTDELYAAVGMNLGNPFIDEVHVLLEIRREDDAEASCQAVRAKASSLLGLGKHHMPMHRLHCVAIYDTPFYSTFFTYANEHLPGKVVMLSNTDVVFDETLGLIDWGFPNQHMHILSVREAPRNGAYRSIFGKECPTSRRCTIGRYDGWIGSGASWDAYIFRAPLPMTVSMRSLDFPMFWLQAENTAGMALAQGGMLLSNPCLHVNAFHWHCQGGKMHADQAAGNPLQGRPALQNMIPCWDCPHVNLPQGLDRAGLLCRGNKRFWLKNEKVRSIFRVPMKTFLCCYRQAGCKRAERELERMVPLPETDQMPRDVTIPLCRTESDVQCLIWAGRENYSPDFDPPLVRDR